MSVTIGLQYIAQAGRAAHDVRLDRSERYRRAVADLGVTHTLTIREHYAQSRVRRQCRERRVEIPTLRRRRWRSVLEKHLLAEGYFLWLGARVLQPAVHRDKVRYIALHCPAREF
jgi:hypothetical protein